MSTALTLGIRPSPSVTLAGPFRLVGAFLAALIMMAMLAGPALAAPGGNSQAAQACKQGGFANWTRDDEARSGFANTGECVSYAAQGGQLVERESVEEEEPGDVVIDDPGIVILPPADTREVSLTWSVAYGHPANFEEYGWFCFGHITVSGFQPGTYEVSISNNQQGRTYQLVVDESGVGTTSTRLPGLSDDSWLAFEGPKTATVDGVTSPESTPNCG